MADEKVLGPDAREWKVKDEPSDITPGSAVVAVSKYGMLSSSAFAQAKPSLADTRSPHLSDLHAKWVTQAGKQVILIEWKVLPDSGPIGKYCLKVDDSRMGTMSNETDIQVTNPGQYIYVPGTVDRSYAFNIIAYGPTAGCSVLNAYRIPAFGRTLLPVIRITPKKAEGKPGHTKVTWEYTSVPLLKGFRLYQDGLLIADENKLDKGAREWTVDLVPDKWVQFQFEAVGTDGSVSDRNAERSYRAPK